MDRMLVVVFDSENKAYDGKKALAQLENEGSIAVYAYAVIGKNPDGTTMLKQGDDPGPLGTLVGTSVGSLVGLLGGPVGLVVGATAGLFAGGMADLNNARVGEDFIDDVRGTATEQVRSGGRNSGRLDDARGQPHGSDRWESLPASTVRGKANASRGERCRHESRYRGNQGGAGQGACRPEIKASGEDQPARLQDPSSTGESQEATPGGRTASKSEGGDFEGESRNVESKSSGQTYLAVVL